MSENRALAVILCNDNKINYFKKTDKATIIEDAVSLCSKHDMDIVFAVTAKQDEVVGFAEDNNYKFLLVSPHETPTGHNFLANGIRGPNFIFIYPEVKLLNENVISDIKTTLLKYNRAGIVMGEAEANRHYPFIKKDKIFLPIGTGLQDCIVAYSEFTFVGGRKGGRIGLKNDLKGYSLYYSKVEIL